MKLNEDGKTVAAMDCLVPGIGEIIGGSQREDDLALLIQRMEEMNLNKEDYDFYLDLRRYGSVRHAGFGLGFERCVMYLTGMGNIRDVVPFPRTVKNCELWKKCKFWKLCSILFETFMIYCYTTKLCGRVRPRAHWPTDTCILRCLCTRE